MTRMTAALFLTASEPRGDVAKLDPGIGSGLWQFACSTEQEKVEVIAQAICCWHDADLKLQRRFLRQVSLGDAKITPFPRDGPILYLHTEVP